MKMFQVICDECGATKKETNHWWKVYVTRDACLAISPYSEVVVGKDVCGQACASKAVSRWLATGFLDSPALRGAAYADEIEAENWEKRAIGAD